MSYLTLIDERDASILSAVFKLFYVLSAKIGSCGIPHSLRDQWILLHFAQSPVVRIAETEGTLVHVLGEYSVFDMLLGDVVLDALVEDHVPHDDVVLVSTAVVS